MRNLNTLDYSIILTYTLICILAGFYFTKKANESTENYFLGGRSMPWWLIGTSMAATNFSTDTPLAITKYIFQEGVAGVWFFWTGAIQVCLATFLFAQLWRRSEVLTDVEIVERRYGGQPASILRVFKGIYFGLIFNTIVMGWVYKGLIKIMTGITNLDPLHVIILFSLLVVMYTLFSGFYGVIWTDFLQYYIAVFACICLAVYSVAAVGGLSSMMEQLELKFGSGSGVTNLYPTWPQSEQWMPFSIFFTYVAIQWWSHKYSDGGGKHIQRMSSAKNEEHAVWGTFFFAFMNYIVQVWPWIITALCALLLIGKDIPDAEMAYPLMISKVAPHGLLGLMVVMAIAAFMSTISTHTNLGSSYMVNDLYRRFINKNASDGHYLWVSRFCTILTMGLSILVAMNIQSIGNTWKLLIEFASGAGITWILRWFWWRINAWSELSAMIFSGLITLIIETVSPEMLYSHKLWLIISGTAFFWLPITFLTKPVEMERLKSFVAKVGPSKFGWKPVYQNSNLKVQFKLRHGIINFILSLIFLFCFNFGIANILLKQNNFGWVQIGMGGITFFYILYRLKRHNISDLSHYKLSASA